MSAAPKPSLFLLDAMALIFRSHFAFIKNPRMTSYGLNTSAIFGFATTLMEVIEKERPTHIGVAFESESPTLRSLQYEAYKAHRQETPEDVIAAIPLVQRLLAALKIPILKAEGYEADDVIATLSGQAEAAGFTVYMMTPDKDYAQLVTDHVLLYRPALGMSKQETLNPQGVMEKFGVRPDQITDLLGLKGDAADNIPGVPKIGDKTALELITQYGSMENILANAENVAKKSVRETLLENAELGRLSKDLATLCTTVPIHFDAHDLEICPPDEAALLALMQELEFRTLANRLMQHGVVKAPTAAPKQKAGSPQASLFDAPAESPLPAGEGPGEGFAPAAALRTIADTNPDYRICTTVAEVEALATELQAQKAFCFDTETTGLDALEAELVGISFSWQAGTGWYIAVPANRAEAGALIAPLKAVFASQSLKIAHNLKYDLAVLANYGLHLADPLYDTMLAHYAINATAKHSMDLLSELMLGYKPVSITELIGPKGKNQKSMREVAIADAGRYAAEDADVTWQLYQLLQPQVEALHLHDVLHRADLPLVPVLERMEREGIRVDVPFLEEYSLELTKELDALEGKIYAAAGEQFNINSPKQLGDIMFDKLMLGGKPKKTKTGQYATDEETLSKLASAGYELPTLILEFRELAKLKSTYVDSLPRLVSPRTGRVHTSYNQAVAVTGRLSSNNPNLQNIPIRTDRGREVRKAFVARAEPGWTLMSADYSQIELRVMAAMSGDEGMMEAFGQGADIHRATAARVFGVTQEEVDGDMRRKAKMVNFGIIYGITAFGLSQRLGIGQREAKDIIDAYFEAYPRVRQFMDECVQKARSTGYAYTLLGRRHRLPDIASANQTVRGFAERNAINTPIQGTAADMMKLAMIRIDSEMRQAGLASRMLLQVHDELVFDCHPKEQEQLKALVTSCMTTAMPLQVPLEVSTGYGPNWLDAH